MQAIHCLFHVMFAESKSFDDKNACLFLFLLFSTESYEEPTEITYIL